MTLMKDPLHLRPLSAVLALVSVLCLLCLTGCALPDISKMDAKIPDGQWEQARVQVGGKFTNTSLDATGVKVDGKWVKGELHFSHSNPWVLKATIDLKVKENR